MAPDAADDIDRLSASSECELERAGRRAHRSCGDPRYDVQLLHVAWPDAGAVGPVTLTHQVAACDRRVSVAASSPSRSLAADWPATRENYLHPMKFDGIVRATRSSAPGK